MVSWEPRGLNPPLRLVVRGRLDGGNLKLQIGLRRDQLCDVGLVRRLGSGPLIDDKGGL